MSWSAFLKFCLNWYISLILIQKATLQNCLVITCTVWIIWPNQFWKLLNKVSKIRFRKQQWRFSLIIMKSKVDIWIWMKKPTKMKGAKMTIINFWSHFSKKIEALSKIQCYPWIYLGNCKFKMIFINFDKLTTGEKLNAKNAFLTKIAFSKDRIRPCQRSVSKTNIER